MPNHPNRNPNSATASPRGAQVRAARMAANMTAGQAGALVYERATRWLAFEEDRAHMHPALWELWQIKREQLT